LITVPEDNFHGQMEQFNRLDKADTPVAQTMASNHGKNKK